MLKNRILTKDIELNDNDTKVLADFMYSQQHLVDNTAAIMALGAAMQDSSIIESALYSLAVAAIYAWENAEEVDLADQLFKKFLGGSNGD